ncbi:MAG: T9SS type A sorting domain-containing protein [Candidatus Cloacimonas sp.]
MTDESYTYLVGCIINGTHFGSTANEDETTTEVNKINLNVYPNPSQQGFDIFYNIPKKYDVSKLTIYNLRGQKVLQAEVSGLGVFHWDGRDTMQNKLASGVCFAKVNILLGQSSSTKLTLK